MHIRRHISFAVILIMAALFCLPMAHASDNLTDVQSAPMSYATQTHDGMVRVHLSSMKNPSTLDVTLTGSFVARGASSVNLQAGEKVRITMDESTGQITMSCSGGHYAMGRELSLLRLRDAGSTIGFRIDQAKMPKNLYPGDLQLKAQKVGSKYRLYPIVHVYMEYYLHGVVPYEMGNSANIEALKAQAVAARTYTLNKMETRSGQLYDVVDTTNDQVYYGNSENTTNCTAAVNATKGIVLTNNGALTNTYYTASNGGQTESAYNMWNSTTMNYLRVKDDPFDRMNNASIVRKVTVYRDNTASGQRSELKSLLYSRAMTLLAAQGYSTSNAQVTQIRSITPHTPKYASPSRLYTKLDFAVTVVTGGASVPLTLTFDIFSELETPLGMSINATENELWSVEEVGGNFVLYARRFGHGVGMSQRGAMQMGSLGYSYDQILGFYYEGSQRMQVTFTHTILSSQGTGSDTITEAPADITTVQGANASVRLAGLYDTLPLRYTADVQGKVLTAVENGGLVTALSGNDAWTLVQLGQIVGYMPTSSLSISASLPASSSQQPTNITRWATVTSSGTLNLRESGSLQARVVAQIPSGAALCVFTANNGWAHVQYGAQVGYASTDFLRYTDAYPGALRTSGSTAWVNIPSGSGSVNMRATASTSGALLTTIPHGTPVQILINDGSWCQVSYGGREGYIMASFLRFDASESGNQPPEAETGSQTEAVVRTASTALNLRAQATTQSAVLAAIPRGESIRVTQRGAEWSAVRYGALSGYVMTQYLHFPSDGYQTPATFATVNTVSSMLNMRSQPRTGSSILTTLPRGTRVGVLQWADGWANIVHDGKSGYAMAQYLLPEENGASVQTAVIQTTSGGLNLRQSASSDAGILTSIPRGMCVDVLEQGSEWCRVRYGDLTGYVMTKYLALGQSSGNTPGWISGDVIGSVNVRSQPSISGAWLASLQPGSALTVLRRDGEWFHVSAGSVNGYVHGDYVTFVRPGPTEKTLYVHTASGGLNLRAEASVNSNVLTVLPRGAAVTLLQTMQDWALVRYENLQGYVLAQYLSDAQPYEAPVQAQQPQAIYDATLVDVPGWQARIQASSLNMRQWCATDAPILTSVYGGTVVELLRVGDTWCHIRFEGVEGYCMTSYLTLLPAMP